MRQAAACLMCCRWACLNSSRNCRSDALLVCQTAAMAARQLPPAPHTSKEVLHTPPGHVAAVLWSHRVRVTLGEQVVLEYIPHPMPVGHLCTAHSSTAVLAHTKLQPALPITVLPHRCSARTACLPRYTNTSLQGEGPKPCLAAVLPELPKFVAPTPNTRQEARREVLPFNPCHL